MWHDPCVEMAGLVALSALLPLCGSTDQAFYPHLASLRAELAF